MPKLFPTSLFRLKAKADGTHGILQINKCHFQTPLSAHHFPPTMPKVPLHLSLPSLLPSTDRAIPNPLPQLLQTPSGLAILEIQGTINLPAPLPGTTSTPVGRLVFPHYDANDPSTANTAWQKTVHLYVGKHQRLTGEVKKLPKAIAVMRKRERGSTAEALENEEKEQDELEIVDIVYYKVLFSSRPEPVGGPE
ncbi:MAG: hypothetical protein Q9163_003644 [Psora crenata]